MDGTFGVRKEKEPRAAGWVNHGGILEMGEAPGGRVGGGVADLD